MRDSSSPSRRQLLGGLGTLLLVGCPRRGAPGYARPATLAPTPAVDDDDGDAALPPIAPAAACAPTADNIEGPTATRSSCRR